MGSALTFPVEAMYFYTIIVLALLREEKRSCTWFDVWETSRRVFVYGDDCIFPAEYAEAVTRCLQEYNCKVNLSKTFYSGPFRESCGRDACFGEDVTPVYVRQPPPFNRKQVSSVVSWVATAHQFYLKGYWRAAELMYSTVERVIGELPVLPRDSPGLGRISFLNPPPASMAGGWNANWHYPEVRAWVVEKVDSSDQIDGFAALSKSLKYGAFESQKRDIGSDEHDLVSFQALDLLETDPHHLERSSARGALILKRRWVPAT
jgi:hypothetical protein